MENIVAIIYLILLGFTIFFQLGLIIGRPWGEWTMGGYHKGVLPIKLRIGAFVSFLILTFFAIVVLDKASLFGINLNLPSWIGLFIIGFNIMAVIANSATKSQKERKLWQPITIIMLVSSLIIFLL